MYEFEADSIERSLTEQKRDLAEQKTLLVNVSRGLDKLAGKRRPAEERNAPALLLIRTIVSHLVSRVRNEVPQQTAKRLYGDAVADAMKQRAASSPAMTVTPGWAADLTQIGGADVLPLLAPASGYAQLVPRTVRVSLSGRTAIKYPARTTGTLPVKFVGQGQPIPVGQAGLVAMTIFPHKLGAIVAFSEELADRSTPSIEAVVRQALEEDAGTYLDSVLFGTLAATTTQPAGLFYAVTPSAGASGGGQAALAADIGVLLSTISPAASPVLVGNASTTARLSIWAPALAVPVIVSEGMADNTLGAIDAAAVMSAEGDSVEIMSSSEAVLHNETNPLAIASGPQGSAVVATPATSLFQTDLVGLRLILHASWDWRAVQGGAGHRHQLVGGDHVQDHFPRNLLHRSGERRGKMDERLAAVGLRQGPGQRRGEVTTQGDRNRGRCGGANDRRRASSASRRSRGAAPGSRRAQGLDAVALDRRQGARGRTPTTWRNSPRRSRRR